MNQTDSKWMIVVVERHVLWNLWCIDFLKKAVKEKQGIIILDLSMLRLRRHKNNSRYLLARFYRKNRIESILRRTAIEQKIERISISLLSYLSSPKNEYHRDNSLSFLNGLDSQYFEEIGARIVDESQIEPKILAQAKLIYNKAFEITTRAIAERGITKVIVPGGRTLIPNAITAATQNMGASCTVLEQATSKSTRYLEFSLDFRQNMYPHQLEMDLTWAKGGTSKYEIAQNYLEKKLHRGQSAGNFSVNFDSSIEILTPENKKLAAIFVGSGFEMVPTDVDTNSIHVGSDHQKRMFELFNKVALENGFSVVLRGHPPSPGYERMFAAEDEEWAEFCYRNKITHLPSLSKVDSYKLMKTSAINVVYASTVGIDSIILGANTLILANTDWAHLVPELCAFDEQSIRNRFSSFERIIDVKKIYPYAFHMECGGIEMANVEYSTDGTLYFEGKEIGAPRIRSLQKILKR